MVFRRIFGKDKEEIPQWDEPTLETMVVGCLLDYDLKTWEVIAQAIYDYDGFKSREWTLRNGDMVRFLEGYEEHGQMHWTLTRKSIGPALMRKSACRLQKKVILLRMCDTKTPTTLPLRLPPAYISKVIEKMAVNLLVGPTKGRMGLFCFLSQWGEREFTAFVGHVVEQYQFSNILPAAKE